MTDAELTALGLIPEKMPTHIAIIMDGNGRWAKARHLPRHLGHRQGAAALQNTLETCLALKIDILSVYVFSTENWHRPKSEVTLIMDMISRFLDKETPKLKKAGVRARVLGRISVLSSEIQQKISLLETETQHNTAIQFNLLINYGGRAEIVDAVQQIAHAVTSGTMHPQDIDETTIRKHLYTPDMPDPDLLIRTGGDHRISNFLLWQLAYTEIIVLDKFWPDFGRTPLLETLKAYQSRDRRFGTLHEK